MLSFGPISSRVQKIYSPVRWDLRYSTINGSRVARKLDGSLCVTFPTEEYTAFVTEQQGGTRRGMYVKVASPCRARWGLTKCRHFLRIGGSYTVCATVFNCLLLEAVLTRMTLDSVNSLGRVGHLGVIQSDADAIMKQAHDANSLSNCVGVRQRRRWYPHHGLQQLHL